MAELKVGKRRRTEAAAPVAIPAELCDEFERTCGLGTYEARVLVALLTLGSGNTLEIARVAQVPRTSTYQVLDALHARNLVQRLPGDWPAVWGCPPRAEVLARLRAEQEDRLRRFSGQLDALGRMIEDSLPEARTAPMPFVQVIHGAVHVQRAYEQLILCARSELLMYTRPPYAWTPGRPNSAVLEALSHGIEARVLYQRAEWEDPRAEAFRAEVDTYHRAGVEARLADELPIKLVVVDRSNVLVSVPDPSGNDAGYPTTLQLDHPGYATVHADAFEHRWASAQPIESV